VAVLAPPGTSIPANVSRVFHQEPRRALAQIAARFYPIQPATIAAVTGTSGKTSTVHFLRQMWKTGGKKSASIGTLGILADNFFEKDELTTPDGISLHRALQMLAKERGVTHAAMEASSHGLDQHRLDGVRIRLAAFTNLSRDHLDYHKTMKNYFAAKLRLFNELLPQNGTAILNADVPEFEELQRIVKNRGIRSVTYGKANADITLHNRKATTNGQELGFSINGTSWHGFISLPGAFQAVNVSCALALALASGENETKLIDGLPQLEGVPGRMEFVGNYKGGAVYVDYAHKPDALENVLQALRPHAKHHLAVVFGCGGNRDTGKRPIMGEIAMRLADSVIVTDDNPRTEQPASIRKEILAGAKGAKEIGDRAEAIAYALSAMQEGDVLVIAGKGHEQGQIIGNETRPFDDRDVARSLIKGKAA
jgi:UDP-N-acetylmuramoyl-L-alanyl-D-glutamate--2,6-diaminopimelate ligase